jgi:hypothetical protein
MNDTRVHPLEIPFVWFVLLLVEWAIIARVLVEVVPASWPTGAVVAVWIAALAGVSTLNYAIRRRFVPH